MQVIGKADKIDLPEFGLVNIPAKIDTGANRSCINCSEINVLSVDGREEISFHIPLDSSHGTNTFHAKEFFKKKIKSSNGQVEERFVIKTTVVLFGRKIKTSFSLTDRAEMKFPILLGRKLLTDRFLVDVAKQNLSYLQKKQS